MTVKIYDALEVFPPPIFLVFYTQETPEVSFNLMGMELSKI